MGEEMLVPSGRSGADLYRIVEAFDSLGIHRTGTETDAATRAWLRDLLEVDVDVSDDPYTFPRFDHDTRLTADGEPMEHLPLFYESTGERDGVGPIVVEAPTVANWIAPELEELVAQATAQDAPALVVATTGASGRLVAFNRKPEPGSGIPVVLVPGRDLHRLRSANEVRLDYSASLTRAQSANVVGRAGSVGPEIVVTTPLTGWFNCAGERGTGIALAVDLVPRLAEHARVTLLATSGHELHHIGARAWLDGSGVDTRPDVVVHLGASMATGPATAPYRGERVLSHLQESVAARIADIYSEGDAGFAGEPDQWVSEAKEWVERADRVLSYSGSFPLFHTPDDRAAASTSPDRLAEASRRLDAAVNVLLETAHQEAQ